MGTDPAGGWIPAIRSRKTRRGGWRQGEGEPGQWNGLALRKGLDPPVRETFREALLVLRADPEGSHVLKEHGATRFIPTANRDYETICLHAHEIGLDLARHDSVNG